MRLARLLPLAAVALTLVPKAQAWTRLTPDSLPNYVGAGVLTTASGTELVGWADRSAGGVLLLRLPAMTPQPLVTGWAEVTTPRFVQLRNGAIVALFSGRSPDSSLRGVVRMTSRDDGATWSPPAQTAATNLAEVTSAAVGPDGSVLFVQAGSLFVDVHRGLDGKKVTNVFTACCAYGPTLAVDSTGLSQVALWSGAGGLKGFLYGGLTPAGTLAGAWVPLSGPDTLVDTDPVPLVANGSGDTFVLWSARSPSAAVSVSTLRGGKVVRTATLARGAFGVSDPHTALAIDRSNRVWALWTRAGALWAARSRTAGASFGAAVRSSVPGARGVYRVSALADDSGATAFVNLGGAGGNALWSQRVLPGLTVVASSGFLRVLDDGFPVAGAIVRTGKLTLRTDAHGRVALRSLKRHRIVAIRRQGYSPTTFRVP